MNVVQLLLYVAVAGAVTSIVPVVVGAPRLRHRPVELKLLWAWMLLGMLLNLAMTFTGLRNTQNTGIAQAGYLVFALLGLYTLAAFVENVGHKRLIYVGLILYIPFWVWRVIAGESSAPFSAATGPVLWLLLVFASALVIGGRLNNLVGPPLRDPAILTGLAVIISYAPSAALEPVSLELFAQDPILTRWLYVARGLLILIGIVTFTLVFAWTIPPRSSPGSSSSVA